MEISISNNEITLIAVALVICSIIGAITVSRLPLKRMMTAFSSGVKEGLSNIDE